MKLDNAQKERNILITLRYIFALDTTTSMIQNGEETDSIYDGVFSSYFIKHDCVLTLDTKKYTAIQTVWLNDIFNSKPHMNLIKTVHDFIIKFKTPILTKNEYELLNVIAGIKFISSVVTSSGRRNTISAQMTNTSWKDIYEKLESQYLPKSSKYKPSERQIELERVFSILKEIFLNPNFPKIFEKIQNKTKELKTTKTDDVKTDLKQLLKQLYSNLYTLEDIIDKIPTVEPLNKIKIVLQKMKEIREEKEIFDENVLKIKYNSKLIGKSNIIPEDYKLFLNDVQRQESSLKKISNEDLQKKIDAYIKNEDYNDDFVHFVYFLYNNGYLNDNDELKDTVNNNDELKNIFTNIIETGTNTEETKKMLKIGYTIDKNNQLEIQLLTDLLEGKIDDSCLVKNMKLTDAYNKTFYNQPPFSYRFRIHPNELKASVTGGRRRKTHKQKKRDK